MAFTSFVLKIGLVSFAFGYITTEVVLFLQGIYFYFGYGLIQSYYEIIFGLSIFLVFGLMMILISLLKTKKQEMQVSYPQKIALLTINSFQLYLLLSLIINF